MLIKFDFGSKTGILVVKFAFGTTNLKIEKLRRRFARVLLLFTRFGKNLRHIESMMSKVEGMENY